MMNSAIERLLSLRVRDAMCETAITVSPNGTLAEAAAQFAKHGLSGGPVVDELGHCVGMLTAADFLRQESQQVESLRNQPMFGGEHRVSQDRADETVYVDTVEHERVHYHMTPTVQSVAADAPLLNAARLMCERHVHRLPVLDPQGHVLGVISALDIVTALVGAIEE